MAYQPQIYYPNNFQQPYQMQQPVPQPQQQNNNGLIWVTGEVGAKSYLVAPNQSILLMDSEGDRFYLKSTDGAGMPTLRTFEYKEVFQNAQTGSNTSNKSMNEQFVTREEYNALNGKYDELLARLEEMQKPKTRKGASVDE